MTGACVENLSVQLERPWVAAWCMCCLARRAALMYTSSLVLRAARVISLISSKKLGEAMKRKVVIGGDLCKMTVVEKPLTMWQVQGLLRKGAWYNERTYIGTTLRCQVLGCGRRTCMASQTFADTVMAICGFCHESATWNVRHKWTVFTMLGLIFPNIPRDIWLLIESFTR